MNTGDLNNWVEIASKLATTAGVVSAAIWFLITTKFKQRVQFDLECNFLTIHNESSLIAEIQLIFENKGFVEHKLYNLNIAVHTLESEAELKEKEKTKELEFKKRLLPKISVVPREYNYFFVRPGVRQVITHIITIPSSISVVRVTASFNYGMRLEYPHTTRRVFQVPFKQKTDA